MDDLSPRLYRAYILTRLNDKEPVSRSNYIKLGSYLY